MLGSGKFTRLMNVTRSAHDPLNYRGVPEDYAPLVLEEEAEFTPSYLNHGPMCSSSVKESNLSGALSATAEG